MYARELWPWTLLGFASGLVEGGTVAVLVKKGFAGLVAPIGWTSRGAGERRTGAGQYLKLCLGQPGTRAGARRGAGGPAGRLCGLGRTDRPGALCPRGLVLTIVLVIIARVLWAGILTVRAAVWSANYPRHIMARITGRIRDGRIAGRRRVALLAGWILDLRTAAARWLYLPRGPVRPAWRAAATVRCALRREYRPARGRSGQRGGVRRLQPGHAAEILREDPAFRSYMFWLGPHGSGNLMMNAAAGVLFTDRLHLTSLTQILFA